MAIKYNGTSPTAINYNGTDLTVVKYGSTAVWGKPYSLSLNSGTHSSIVVTRTSSPNQGASIGVLSSGSVIYHGDTLVIYGAASEGYKLDTFTVNGVNWTPSDTITVTGAISVVATAVADASWKTVWTGSKRLIFDSATSSAITPSQTGFSGMNKNYPTRITGYFMWYEEKTTWSNNQVHFTLEKGQYLYQNTLDTKGHEGDFSITTKVNTNYCFLGIYDVTSTALEWYIRNLYSSGSVYCSIDNLYVTKIEQYY